MALGAVIAFSACDSFGRLDTPEGFQVDKTSDVLNWNAVENADYYDVYFVSEDGVKFGSQRVNAPSCSLSQITTAGTYKINVQAFPDEEDLDSSGNPRYKESKEGVYTYVRGNNLGSPTGIEVSQTDAELNVRFNPVEGAVNYTIRVSGTKYSGVLSEVTTELTSYSFTKFTVKSDSDTETEYSYTSTPDKYVVTVRANAAAEAEQVNSKWSANVEYTVKGTLTTPYITKLSITSENSQRIEWKKVSSAKKLYVEAWALNGQTAEEVLAAVQSADNERKPDYVYSPTATAMSCQLSSLNIDKEGEYLLTVRAEGEQGVYDSTMRVNAEEGALYTVNYIQAPVNSDTAPLEGEAVRAYVWSSGSNNAYDRVTILFNDANLASVNNFKLVLSSINTSSGNSISDITVSINLAVTKDSSGNVTEVKISETGDTYKGATLTEVSDGNYKIEYNLDRIFHSEGTETSDPAAENAAKHNQTSSTQYGRYFNISVQAAYLDRSAGQTRANLPSAATMTDGMYLSFCTPEKDEHGNYIIKTTYLTEDGEVTGEVYASAWAQLMYIQRRMLEGSDMSGETFMLGEDVNANSNAWFALDTQFNGTFTSAPVAYGETMLPGNYSISDMVLLNVAKVEYSKTDKPDKPADVYANEYAFFGSIGANGKISNVNFINITATDSEYKYSVTTGEGEDEKEEIRYQYPGTAGVITCVNNGVIEYVFVSGKFSGINNSGVMAAVNNNKILACESDVTFSAKTAEGAAESYAGGIAGKNNGEISACSYRGDINYGNTVTSTGAAGGVAGYNGGQIGNSYKTGNISVTSVTTGVPVGGFVGLNDTGAEIYDSYMGNKYTNNMATLSSVSGESVAGGFAGINKGSISRAYSVAKVSGTNGSVGGFVGINSGSVSYAYSAGTTTRGGVSAPSFIYGQTDLPANCFMQDARGGSQYESLENLMQEALLSGGFGRVQNFSTPLLEGMLYPEAYKDTIAAGTSVKVKAVMTVNGQTVTAGYDGLDAAPEGYAFKVLVSGGKDRLNSKGVAVVKYVLEKEGSVVSCATIIVTI